MANNTINDGSVVYGSLPLTIGGQAYETEDLNIDFDVTRIVRKNSLNIPTGKVITLGETTGTATLIYASSSVNKPAFGAAFSYTDDGLTYTCTVEKVGKPRVMAGEAKVKINFSVNITGSVVLSQN